MSGGTPLQPADLILHSGRLWDGGDLEGQDAVAVGGGRIVATGTDNEVERHRSDHTRLVDVGGRRIMPGLIDSHLHMVRAGLRWNEDVRWHDVGSLAKGLDDIARAAEGRDPGRWIAVLGGWHPHQFTEGRPPSRGELDEVAPNHPVFVQRNYIEAFLNTRALEETGWADGDMPAWPIALQTLREKLPAPHFEARVRGTETMLRDLNRLGLTGCIDAGGFGMDPDAYRPITELYERGEHGFRARLLVGAARPGTETAQLEDWMSRVSPGSGGDFLRYLGAGEVLLFGA
ncbi:MAG: amidohydrolase family protein, partial [Acidimicrobiia bacterium]